MGKQRDLFMGNTSHNQLRSINKRLKNPQHYTKKGKLRTIRGEELYIQQEINPETLEEQENKENGGTEYWGTFRR